MSTVNSSQCSPNPAEPPVPLPFVPGSFTLVVLPDTQWYAESFPEQFEAQTRWIMANRVARNIPFVIHVGDLTNRNLPAQWENVRRALQHLDGMPFVVTTGNHDYGRGGDTDTRESGLNEFFTPALFTRQPTFGGLFEPERLENSYHLFSAGGKEWLVVALEFGPRDAVVDWANRVLAEHPTRRTILVTHAYLYSDNTRYDHVRRPDHQWNPHAYPSAKLPGGTNDAQQLWEELVSRHDHIDFVLCGHVLNEGAARLSSPNPRGHVVHQLMADYQERAQGGEGYLRLMEFLPDGRTVQVKTYSPTLDRYLTDERQEFVLRLGGPGDVKT
jgi:hypothetical protein